jgi:alpha-L-arabinofuranosidase
LRYADTVHMANMAPVINTRGPLFVHSGGIVRRTTFHVLKMYANLLGEMSMDAFVQSDMLAHEGQSVQAFDGIVTCNAARTDLQLALINRDPVNALSCTVNLAGQPLQGVYPATTLAGDSADAFNDIDNPDRVTPEPRQLEFESGAVTLPPHSITILEVRK